MAINYYLCNPILKSHENVQIFENKNALSAALAEARSAGKKIGFVPTMGALHKGHCTLVERSVAECDITVVSIFVNPTQFNNSDDLAKYPRTLERDAAMLETVGADYIFSPSTEEMYNSEELKESFHFDFGGLDSMMEGKFRPGHFNGVVQVVSKLFDMVQPHRAYFGEKDFQQLAIVHHMVELMGYAVEIVDCPIVREESGLAMSSRNERLSATERQQAAHISRILFQSVDWAKRGAIDAVARRVVEEINAIDGLEVEYFEVVNQRTLQPATQWRQSIGCITVYCGGVRLIDNVKYA